MLQILTVMVTGMQQVFTFKYPEVIHNHYQFCDIIDSHNSQHIDPTLWRRHGWPLTGQIMHCVSFWQSVLFMSKMEVHISAKFQKLMHSWHGTTLQGNLFRAVSCMLNNHWHESILIMVQWPIVLSHSLHKKFLK